ncbi:transcriptional regulator [Brevibacillus choshinensis]|uniref:transcriptional regulator n=1 Tax=Brevibacillus choshinensis TaxID=54911 RepID=UPI002E200E00|nr:transcriptional regulator [Brevibacillus choshinensis]
MTGLGKTRTKLGEWLDERGIKQQWLIKESGLSKSTISNATSKLDHYPHYLNMSKIVEALKKIDASVTNETFWPTQKNSEVEGE